MYNGFDWYGRTLEVREVSMAQIEKRLHILISNVRTAMPGFRVQVATAVHSVVAYVVASEVVASEAVAAASEVASGGDSQDRRRVLAEISLNRIFTPIILVLINNSRLLAVFAWTAMEVAMEGPIQDMTWNLASRSWFAM